MIDDLLDNIPALLAVGVGVALATACVMIEMGGGL